MTQEEARSIQFLRSQVGLTYRRLAEWWCWTQACPHPQALQQFGQLICNEAESILGLDIGHFDRDMKDTDTLD